MSRSKSKLVKFYLSKKLNYFKAKVEDKIPKNNEKDTKQMLPDVDYKAAKTHKHIRKKVPNDGDTPEVYLNVNSSSTITLNDISQLSFSSFIYMCAISSEQQTNVKTRFSHAL